MTAPTPSPADRLPLFPLPLVLFPGAALPLHIFEPRYRQLLRDVRGGHPAFGDGRFGIVLAGAGGQPGAGLVGCVAQVRDVETLPDGRSNLVVDGGSRFVIRRLVDTDRPYAVAEVAPYPDLDDAVDAGTLERTAERVRAVLGRVAAAAATLADRESAPPTLPDDPTELGFAVGAMVDFDLADRQRLLASRSPAERLVIVLELLARAVDGVEARAAVHTGARSNGKGPH